MEQPPQFRTMPLVVAACCVVIVAVAVFGGGWPWQSGNSNTSNNTPNLTIAAGGTVSQGVRSYACPKCGRTIDWGKNACVWCGWARQSLATPAALAAAPTAGPRVEAELEPLVPNGQPGMGNTQTAVARRQMEVEINPGLNPAPPVATPVALAAAPTAAAAPIPTDLMSPRDQNAAGKEFIEGHWLGLEVIPLTPELAKEYLVPKGENGILVDEITLEAAESGILAGDMVQSVDGRPTPDLKAFFVATQRVQEKERADVGISRRGKKMSFFMEARNTRTLGFSQMEAAQPITPGALSPHRSRGKACTECHIIMLTGGQLPTDAGDILPTPPAITKNAVATHGNRGQCVACHVVK